MTMANKEKVFEAFGELLYAVARAEGKVRKDTAEQVAQLLDKYTWASDAIWSFKYEKDHKTTFEETYDQALDTFVEHGPMEEYKNFFELLDELSDDAHPLLGNRGKKILINFKRKLNRKFMENEDIFSNDEFEDESGKNEPA
jgi:hypothetical protein